MMDQFNHIYVNIKKSKVDNGEDCVTSQIECTINDDDSKQRTYSKYLESGENHYVLAGNLDNIHLYYPDRDGVHFRSTLLPGSIKHFGLKVSNYPKPTNKFPIIWYIKIIGPSIATVSYTHLTLPTICSV